MSTLKETIIYDLFTGLYTKEYFNQILKKQSSPYLIVTITVENLEMSVNHNDVILSISNYLLKHSYISSMTEKNKFTVIIPNSYKADKFISDISSTNITKQKISFYAEKK